MISASDSGACGSNYQLCNTWLLEGKSQDNMPSRTLQRNAPIHQTVQNVQTIAEIFEVDFRAWAMRTPGAATSQTLMLFNLSNT